MIETNRSCRDEFKYTDLLDSYIKQSKEILKENLVGIYLHGSAVMGCFNPDKSDIDLIVVVKEPPSGQIKREYMDMVVEQNTLGPAKGIEMSIVKRDVCNPFVYPTPFELHFSVAHLNRYKDNPDDYVQKMKGTDKDLAAHFTIITNRGRCLYGEPIEEVFGAVPKVDYMDSIYEDIADAADEMVNNTMYLTLNLARVLAYKNEGLILSKKEGGQWALENLPEEYHELVTAALEEYETNVTISYNEDLARHYAEHMLNIIRCEGVMGNIEYTLHENQLKAEDFIRLKMAAGFRERPTELVAKALKNNLFDVTAVVNGEVIGMGRLVGDGVMYWYLQEIVVLPEYQGKGIGTAIVNRLLQYITEHTEPGNFTSVGLTAAEGKNGFYERFGFKKSNGMTKYIERE